VIKTVLGSRGVLGQLELEALVSLDSVEIRQIGHIKRWQRGNLVGR
jgi:hypothetical protein